MGGRLLARLGLVVLLVLVVGASARAAHGTSRPIFGIVSAPEVDEDPESNIGAGYVKFLESAGARVAPIPYNASPADLSSLFHGVNGLLFTGGGLSLLPNTTYYKTSRFLLDLAVKEWEKGVNFPVHGTCMGFQLLAVLIAETNSVLLEYHFDSENLSLPLDFTPHARESRLFGTASTSVMRTFALEPVTMNLHHDGVVPEAFETNDKLKRFARVLATNVDRKNQRFVSAFEGRHYPLYAVQFHPERNAYEWDAREGLAHTREAVVAMQHLANVLVGDARMNNHRFASREEEDKALIYRVPPVYTGGDADTWTDELTYFFK